MNKILKIIIYILLGVILISTYVYFASFYTVTFITDSKVVQKKIRKGDSLPKEIPVKSGYKFLYWVDDSTIVDSSYVLNYDAVLVAVFDKIITANTYTVTFDTDGGSVINNQIVGEGDKIIEPENPTKEGYIFKEWVYNDETFDFNTEITNNITLKSTYIKENEKTYLVSFNTNGGNKISDKIVLANESISRPSNPIKPGYVFKEWQLNGSTFDFNTKINQNITLNAIYTIDNRKIYTISFDTKGGNEISNQMVRSNDKVVKPQNPVKKGYTFVNWLYESNIFDFNTKVNKNMTLEATYIKNNDGADGNSYVVTFDSDGGTNIPLQLIEKGNKVSKPENPTKEGYTFIEWQLDNVMFDFNSPVTSSITIKAIYKKDGEEVEKTGESKKYTITFDTKGGSEISNQIVEEGYKVYKPEKPTKEGYIFKYWSYNNTEYDFNTDVNSDITLIAVYEKDLSYKKKYTITFDTDGGSVINNQIVYEGDKIIEPENPTKEGYKFLRWEYNGTEYNFNAPVSNNISLKAIYTIEVSNEPVEENNDE